jgi:hypothetical protein
MYNCLGALDGTPIKVIVQASLKGRYRSRKADIVGYYLVDARYTNANGF